MNAQQVINQAISWLRTFVTAMVLLMVAAELARALGVQLPIRTLGHVELAYLAGATWLTR